MRILVVEPLMLPYVKDIDGTLESMQSVVGGYIEAVYPFEDNVALICNEDGKIGNLPLNRALYGEDGDIYDIIAGTFFICAAPDDSDSFVGLSDEQIEIYKKRFQRIELYI